METNNEQSGNVVGMIRVSGCRDRGDDVLAVLLKYGGKNIVGHDGCDETVWYIVGPTGYIGTCNKENISDYFLERYTEVKI